MTTDKPTILQVIPELGSGGAERGCVDVAAGIVAAGGVSYVMSEGGVLERELQRVGAHHIQAPLKGRSPWAIKRNRVMMEAFIREHNVRLIHARSRAPAWSAYRAAKACGIPFVTTFHGYYRTSFPGKKFYNSVMGLGDRVICGSNFIANHARDVYKVDHRRIRVIYRGINLDRFNPSAVTPSRLLALADKTGADTDKALLLFPARYSGRKGHAVLIKALERIKDRPLLCICMGGITSQSYFNRIVRMAERSGVKNKVMFLEHFDDLPAAYKLADAVLQPCLEEETFCRVAGEALAMGCPIIATNIGALPEVVPEDCGWLVSPGDVAALAEAISGVLELSSEQRAHIYDTGIQCASERYDLKKMVDGTLDVYNELL